MIFTHKIHQTEFDQLWHNFESMLNGECQGLTRFEFDNRILEVFSQLVNDYARMKIQEIYPKRIA